MSRIWVRGTQVLCAASHVCSFQLASSSDKWTPVLVCALQGPRPLSSYQSMGEDGAFCSTLASATPAPAQTVGGRVTRYTGMRSSLQHPGFQTAKAVCRQLSLPGSGNGHHPFDPSPPQTTRSSSLILSVPSLPEASIQSSPSSLHRKQKPLKGTRAVQSLCAFLLTALAMCTVRAISQLLEAQFSSGRAPLVSPQGSPLSTQIPREVYGFIYYPSTCRPDFS